MYKYFKKGELQNSNIKNMLDYGKITIIVPFFNGEKYLNKCVLSILNQKYDNFELILINDGSTDNSELICNNLRKLNNKIKLISLKNNTGVSNARNVGIKMATGKFITFVDVDDIVKEKIYIDNIHFMNNEIDLVMFSYINEFDRYFTKEKFPWKSGIKNNEFIKKMIIPRMLSKIDSNGNFQTLISGCVWRCIFKKEIILKKNIFFNRDIIFGEDLVFCIKYLIASKNVILSNKYYYVYNRIQRENKSLTTMFIKDLKRNLELVDNEIYDAIKGFYNFHEKNWRLRKVTNIYSIIVNECKFGNDKSINKKLIYLKSIYSHEEKYKIFSSLQWSEFYGLRLPVVFCIKKNLYFFIILYFSYIKKLIFKFNNLKLKIAYLLKILFKYFK